MTTAYLIQAAATIAAAFALYALMLRRKGQEIRLAGLGMILCTALGLAAAKLFYVVLLQLDYIVEWGEWEVLWDLDPKRLCFVGGAVGVWLGIRLTARILKTEPRAALDTFAVPGALLVAGLRLAEGRLGKLGAGALVEGTGFFTGAPFTVTDSWGDRYLAVFFLEAAVALLIAIYAWRMREDRTGVRFEKTVFALALCQVLLENLRNQAMKWGFVYVEQILCAVILMALLLMACVRREGGRARFLPAAWMLLCMGGVVGEEFARQKGSSEALADLGYWMMGAILILMAWIYGHAIRKEKLPD